jgi:hypothetical protein
MKMPFVVLAGKRHVLHLTFDLDPANAIRLAQMLHQLPLPPAVSHTARAGT